MTTTRVNTSARGAQRKLQIVEAAANLFERRGYHETTMDLIAANVGIRKPSLYHYFASKDEILVVIHEEMINLIIATQEDRVAAGELTPDQMLRAIMTDLVSLMETHPGHLRIFFEHWRELPEDVATSTSRKRDHYQQLLVDVLEAGVAEGRFRIADTKLASFAILGMCNWTYQWFHPGRGFSAAQVADAFWRFFVEGISPVSEGAV